MPMYREGMRAMHRESPWSPEISWKNVGDPPITGLVEVGQIERKEPCEDVKLNDPDKKLFVVADGVSTSHGVFAAFETARIINEQLGGMLEDEIENVRKLDQMSDKRKSELIDQYIKDRIRSALLKANQAINTRATTDRSIGRASTTASVMKIVDLPNGIIRVFYANVGDSRIYLMHNKKLNLLTEDDGYITQAVQEKRITPAQARQIDQADSADDLPENLKFYHQHKNVVTNVIGGSSQVNIQVMTRDVQPGDRFLLASDGLTDQLTTDQIAEFLRQSDDRTTERRLQHTAEQMSLQGRHPRAKADDISAIVYTVIQASAEKTSPQIGDQTGETASISKEEVDRWRTHIQQLEAQIRAAKKQGGHPKQLEKELARFEYWVARMDLQSLESSLPEPLKSGVQVRVLREDLETSGPDLVYWTVKTFQPEHRRYVISHPSGHRHALINRFVLEKWQSGDDTGLFAQLSLADKLQKKMNDAKKRFA